MEAWGEVLDYLTNMGGYTGFTEEQLWCRAHGRHRDCMLADCRAEEVRMTLYMHATGKIPGPGSGGCYDTVRNHMLAINRKITPFDAAIFVNFGLLNSYSFCGVCVTSDDALLGF